MFKSLKNYTLATPALLALVIAGNGLTAVSANANERPVDSNEALINQISEYNKTEGMGQVTSVSQLRDVSPTDWAFEALRNLVERYGCIAGYPDRTFRGNRALSRYEFAAGLNACMQALERLIAEGGGVSNEDLERLNRLVNEFQSELAALGARVDKLEGKVALLENRQFSTTTKLRGEAIIAVVGQDHTSDQGKWERFYRPKFGATVVDAGGRQRIDSQATMSNRVRLTLDSSFTGKDLLRARLEAGNIP
ncbi:MAG: iron uptake porin, partial [Geminocystis sp.]|nr:iron uptake porin [Geminocystis sp.]